MSDPVTNAEVEDVLSSIRRLVSEDTRPQHRTAPVQHAAPEQDDEEGALLPRPGQDRLVLTPALRVAEVTRAAVERGEAEAKAPRAAAQILQLGEAEALPRATEASGDTSVTEASDDASVTGQDPSQVGAAEALKEDFHFVSRSRRDPQGEAAEVDLPEQDRSEEVAPEEAVSEEAAPEQDAPEEAVAAKETTEPFALCDAQSDAQPVERKSLSAKIAALEAVIGKRSETWEPDDTGGDEYSGTDGPTMAWEDDVERDATGAPLQAPDEADTGAGMREDDNVEAEPIEVTPDDLPDLAAAQEPEPASEVSPDAPPNDTAQNGAGSDGEDQILDEEALRELVSEIVRSELQGALGERITRNVRKLVRREIHRALSVQDLE
ncbi:hypothetical protein ACFSUD_06150 [Sulfitobacter aestuarii]|uniref:Glycerol-3-phosphate dehydrogenase n=1 Tax=Sulfitobacter aestuarii TaxID=2161676 RepID=A0ABW5U1I1_9RHOB